MPSRERLLNAAKDLLWQDGFAAMSPAKVLNRSGVGQGSLYHYFTGKPALAVAALDEVSTQFQAATEQQLSAATGLPPLERVRRWLMQPREALKGCRMGRLAAETAVTSGPVGAPVAAYFRHLERHLATTLKQAMGTGALPAGLDPAALAACLTAVVQGGYVLSRATNDAGAMDRACAGALALLTAATNTPDAGGRHGRHNRRRTP
jgi:AcrR family transcriptional regulator